MFELTFKYLMWQKLKKSNEPVKKPKGGQSRPLWNWKGERGGRCVKSADLNVQSVRPGNGAEQSGRGRWFERRWTQGRISWRRRWWSCARPRGHGSGGRTGVTLSICVHPAVYSAAAGVLGLDVARDLLRDGNGCKPDGYLRPKPVPDRINPHPLRNPHPPRVQFCDHTRARAGLVSHTRQMCIKLQLKRRCNKPATWLINQKDKS